MNEILINITSHIFYTMSEFQANCNFAHQICLYINFRFENLGVLNQHMYLVVILVHLNLW